MFLLPKMSSHLLNGYHGLFPGVKRPKPAADRLLQRLRMNAATTPFPLCSCVTCKGGHFADEGLNQSFHIAVD
jgi:hypothetical protein